MAIKELPGFLRKEGEGLVYNGEGELVFYLPEEYFASTGIAIVFGSYISMLGICNYALFDKNGKQAGDYKVFHFPTIMLCKPSLVEKVKGLRLGKNADPSDYRLLHFRDGDDVITSTKVPMQIDNVELFFKLFIITGKIPTTIPYDKIHEYFKENANLNNIDYGINMQFIGLIISELCRDPNDLSKPFRLTTMKDMNGYKPVSIKTIPNYISPFVAITSENFDESLMAAVTTEEDRYSPLEKILMM